MAPSVTTGWRWPEGARTVAPGSPTRGISHIQATATDSSVNQLHTICQQTRLLWPRDVDVYTDLAQQIQPPDPVGRILSRLAAFLGPLSPDRNLHVPGEFMRADEGTL